MLKFIWGKGSQPTPERLKIQEELFGFSKVGCYGYPHKPTSMAYDLELHLLAIGTKQGTLRIYGKSGVEFSGEHDDEQLVSKLLFLPGQGRLVSLTVDNNLHLWEINENKLEVRKTTGLEGRLKQISVLCHDSDNKKVLLGTEGGNIYILNLANFQIEENIIYQDIVMQNSPDDFKVNPGAVEALLIHPLENEKILIGYARGLIVLWDRSSTSASQTYVGSQQLEAIAFRNDGSEFVSAHNDGSYLLWSTSSSEPMEPPNMPYGPYACKAITNVLWRHIASDSWLFFSGGMPRASYGDKFTVTVKRGESQHIVFDLTSKIVDILVVDEAADPSTLFILSEEELVAIDLVSSDWPVLSLPYLNPVHASAITCLTHVTDVTPGIIERIAEAGRSELKGKVSLRNWPIIGGTLSTEGLKPVRDILITGHEDGSAKFWSCSGVTLTPLATVKTSKFFVGDDLDEPRDDADVEDEWPPFRKVGCFDPYSDDPRLAVKKVAFCGQSGRLIVGGTAGQVVVLDLMDSNVQMTIQPVKTDLVTEKEGFIWKGHSALTVRTNEIKMTSGYQPSCIVQISPPASINSVSFSREWGLVSVGTAHGLIILDCFQKIAILTKCTLNAQDIANADDNPMSRRKSLKKSLRESFRRLRKGRSQRNIDKKKTGATTNDIIKKDIRSDSPEARPVERAIEARTGSEDGLGSMVRCLHFAHTYIANPQTISATLWAGTNSGQVLVFLLNIPVGGSEKRNTEKVSAILAKEIQLRHKAPVIGIQVVDSQGVPVVEGGDVSVGVDNSSHPHRVLISSEEQFKLFVLPTLKPCGKYKMTAHEGSRIRKVGFTTFVSKTDPDYSENCFTCLSNQGDLSIHSLPDLRRQIQQTSCMRKEDVQGISSFIWTPKGEGFFLCSSSELQRISLAAKDVSEPQGILSLPPDARPPLEDVKKPVSKTGVSEDGSGDSDSTVHRQNQLNEREASGKLIISDFKGTKANGCTTPSSDQHNETTISEISADITIDSVRDHTMVLGPSLPSLPEVVVHSAESTTITTSRVKMSSSSVVIQNITTKAQINGEASVNGVIESLEKSTVSTHEIEEITVEEQQAPLASLESTSEFQSLKSTN